MKHSWIVGSKRQLLVANNIKESLKRKMEISITENASVSTSTKKIKRYRSAFTTEQVHHLETEFKKFAYIGSIRRRELSEQLNIPERAIKIWFQNRRMKEKKDTSKGSDDEQKCLQFDKSNDGLIRKQLINDSNLSTNHQAPLSNVVRVDIVTNSDIVNNVIDMRKSSTSQNNASSCSDMLQEAKNTELHNVRKFDNVSPYVNRTDPLSRWNSGSTGFLLQQKSSKGDENSKVIKQDIHTDKNMKSSDDIHFVTSSSQSLNFQHFIPPTLFPQDLTSKADVAFLQPSIDNVTNLNTSKPCNIASSNLEKPLYLNGIYAQAYFPPGNMMWKPINVAPIMSTGLSNMFGSNNIGAPDLSGLSGVPLISGNRVQNETLSQGLVKNNCKCNCHEKAGSPVILHQANAIPHVQYLITGLPFQNRLPNSELITYK